MTSYQASILAAILSILVREHVAAFSVEPNRRRVGSTSPSQLQGRKTLLVEADTTTAKQELLQLLQQEGEENTSSSFALDSAIESLRREYKSSQIDARNSTSPSIQGVWRELQPPLFPGWQGLDSRGKPLYSVARLTLGKITPAVEGTLLCAIEGTEQVVSLVKNAARVMQTLPIPSNLQRHVKADLLRKFNIDTYFSIADYDIKGVFRTEGYILPHASEQNRLETWFRGGRCLAQASQNAESWLKVFGTKLPAQKRPFLRKLAALFGIKVQPNENLIEDPNLVYAFDFCLPAHHSVIYLDNDLRITVGNRGTFVVNVRVDG